MANKCRALTPEEAKRAVAACRSAFAAQVALRNVAMVVVQLRTGFRISELLSLTLGDVVERGQIVASVRVPARRMKGKAETREVPLHQEAREALEAWIRELARQGWQRRDVPLFLSRNRDRLGRARAISRSEAWHIMQQIKHVCGLLGTVGTHSLRKSFGEAMLRACTGPAGADGPRGLLLVQRAMGHAKFDSTLRYLEVGDDEVRRLILEGQSAGP